MEIVHYKISKKLFRSNNVLYQELKSTDDLPFDPSKFWLSAAEFEALESIYPHFSSVPLISGMLFSKSKKASKNRWFKAKFSCLFKDYIVFYSKKDLDHPKRVILLRGVHFRPLEDFMSPKELKTLSDEGIIEKKCFVLSRMNNYEVFFAGTNDLLQQWITQLKKNCILHHFKHRYKPIQKIASGSTSMLIEALSMENKDTVVVKIFDKNHLEKTYAKLDDKHKKIFNSIENEINILRALDQENTVRILEVYENKKLIHVIFERLQGGDLYQKIVSLKKETFQESEIKKLMAQLISAIRYLHHRNIMHRDIKLENILFVKPNELNIKLADFGLAENCKKKVLLFHKCGTPGYVAPEVLGNKPYDTRCDIFSLGVILYVLITGKPLFPGDNYTQILNKNKDAANVIKKLDTLGMNVSFECVNLLKKLLKIDPLERPTSDEILEHPWFINSGALLLSMNESYSLSMKSANLSEVNSPEKKFPFPNKKEESKENNLEEEFEQRKKKGFSLIMSQRLARKTTPNNSVHHSNEVGAGEFSMTDSIISLKSSSNQIEKPEQTPQKGEKSKTEENDAEKVEDKLKMSSSMNLRSKYQHNKKSTQAHNHGSEFSRKKSKFASYLNQNKQNGSSFLKLANASTIVSIKSIQEEMKDPDLIDIALDTPGV